jgi:putative transposase
VLDFLVQGQRDNVAAQRFFRRLLKGLKYVPRVMVTDQLRSYGAAIREILPRVEHRQHRYLNNRAEHSHQPTRRRSGACSGLNRPGRPSVSSQPMVRSGQHFRPRCHLLTAPKYRQEMGQRFHTWQEITSRSTAA